MYTYILYAVMSGGEKFALGSFSTEKAAKAQYIHLTSINQDLGWERPAKVLGIKSFTIQVLTVKQE